MISTALKFRIKAFTTHLGISLSIALVSLYLVFILWHPFPLDKAVGVTSIFLMMLAIDAILGPLLTFVVAKPNKKSLKFDLMVIIVLQLSAYCYGMYNISLNRPVYIAFDTKRFELVQASDVPQSSLEKAKDNYDSLGYGSYQWVAVTPAKNATEQQKRIFDEMGDGVAPSMQPDLYEPLENQWDKINAEAKPISELNNYNNIRQVTEVLADYDNVKYWLPLKAYQQNMVVLIDKENSKIVDVVDLRPW